MATTQSMLAQAYRSGATAGAAANMEIDGNALISTLKGRQLLVVRGSFGSGVRYLYNKELGTHERKQLDQVADRPTRETDDAMYGISFARLDALLPNWRTIGIELGAVHEQRALNDRQTYGGAGLVQRRLVWAGDRSKCWLTDWESSKWLELDGPDLMLLKLTPENNPEWARERVYRKRAEFARAQDIPLDDLDKVPVGEQAMAIRIDRGPWTLTTSGGAAHLAVSAREAAKRDVHVDLFHLDRMIRMYPSWSVTCYFRDAQEVIDDMAAAEAEARQIEQVTEMVMSACG